MMFCSTYLSCSLSCSAPYFGALLLTLLPTLLPLLLSILLRNESTPHVLRQLHVHFSHINHRRRLREENYLQMGYPIQNDMRYPGRISYDGMILAKSHIISL